VKTLNCEFIVLITMILTCHVFTHPFAKTMPKQENVFLYINIKMLDVFTGGSRKKDFRKFHYKNIIFIGKP